MLLLRRCAALIAAYAVALQLVLPAFAAVAPLAAGAGFAICRSDGAAAPAGDTRHVPCLACAAHCAGTAPPARDAIALMWPADAAPAAVSFFYPPRHTASETRDHSPRAPPFG